MSTAQIELPQSRHEWPRMSMAQAMALSALLHALIAAIVFGIIKAPETQRGEPEYYTVNIVEPQEVLPATPPSEAERPRKMRSRGLRPPSILAPSQPARQSQPNTQTPIFGIEPQGAPAPPALAPPALVPPRVRLLDPDVIGDIAMSRAPAETMMEKGGVTFDTKEIMYKGYMDLLRDKIQAIWVYPREAAERKLYGDLYINFTIRRDGTLGAVRVVRTSGYSMLDEAALRALRGGQPYWPLPESWDMESITIKGHFIYALEGYYLK